MRFDGDTYNPKRDQIRLTKQWWAVWRAMSDGQWHTLSALSGETGYPEASISARLRDFRKARFGGHTVLRKYLGNGLWMYRLLPNPHAVVTQKEEDR